MVWPSWLWIGTPFKFWLWLTNRLATGGGLWYLWRRLRSRRHFWLWFIVIQLLSVSVLVSLFFWLR